MFDSKKYESYKSHLFELNNQAVINEYCFCRDGIISKVSCGMSFIVMLSMCVEVLTSRGVEIKYTDWVFKKL